MSIMVATKPLGIVFVWILLFNAYVLALPHVFLLASPGAGKGTLSQMLTKSAGYFHVGCGDVLREEIKKKTELGSIIKNFFDTDQIVPDAIIIEMIKNRIAFHLMKGEKIIVEGFPENYVQAKFLDEYLIALGIKNVCFVHLLIDPQVALHRMLTRKTCSQCGAPYNTKTNIASTINHCNDCNGQLLTRPDDNEVRAQQRVAAYACQAKPLLDFYRAEKKLITIDGNKEIYQVFENFMTVLTINDTGLS